MKVKPFGKRIHIVTKEASGNFEVNDSVKLPDTWIVKAIGDEVKSIKVGDILFLKGYALEHVVDDDTGLRYTFTLEDDDFILCVCGNIKDA